MSYKLKGKSKFVRRGRATRRTMVRPKVSKKTMAKVARAVVSRYMPDKEVRDSAGIGLYSYPNVVLGAPPNLWTNNNIIDTSTIYAGISQGTGEGNRVANIIRPKKFNFSFMLTPNDTSIPSPIFVRMYIATFRFDPNNAVAADIWGSCQDWSTTGGINRSFFDNGNTSTGMAGDLTDLLKPINTDCWMVKKVKTFKVGVSSTPALGSTQYGNNDFKYVIKKSVNLLPYIPKRIVFNDTATNSLNKKTFIIFQCIRADNVTNNVNTQYAKLFYNFHFKYESV